MRDCGSWSSDREPSLYVQACGGSGGNLFTFFFFFPSWCSVGLCLIQRGRKRPHLVRGCLCCFTVKNSSGLCVMSLPHEWARPLNEAVEERTLLSSKKMFHLPPPSFCPVLSCPVLQVGSMRCRQEWSWTVNHQSAESSWSNSWTSWRR